MNQNFDNFVKEHLQEILCEAEKEHALAFIKKAPTKTSERAQLKHPHPLTSSEILLQDCAVSPGFSKSRS
jgi:hypothetical protein